jgi:hypothetical protein
MILSFHLYEKKLIFILAVISILDTLFSMIDLSIIRNLFFLSIQLADDMTLQLTAGKKVHEVGLCRHKHWNTCS